ncbi:hypothetical protein O163_09120 [Caldanaerobacter subterraneus subsp. yonseiensis KB-1]|uniref:Uncharacterized protein n=2 Tax=Caldanaerobacter subterraneus TaxID=911092 RepID=U5CPI6_CALSX|nr:hypothetical protein O163_09120 [Caldanaerobacter subterraneus subsp. yonseiensis KB-1]
MSTLGVHFFIYREEHYNKQKSLKGRRRDWMSNRDKYLKGFLAGVIAAAYVIPKMDLKKYRRYKDMFEKNFSKVWRAVKQIKLR